MGRGRDFRGGGGGRGRRASEEDFALDPGSIDPIPRPAIPSPVATVETTVKWFNPEKGFGFVAIADGSGDAFLPLKAVQALGRDTVSPGATLKVLLGQGERGRHVTKIVAIDDSGTTSTSSPRPSSPDRGKSLDVSTAIEMQGKVKWFSVEKGMGFVEVEDGGKDVFLHISVVRQAQISGLSEGQRISMRVTETEKGRQAVSIATID